MSELVLKPPVKDKKDAASIFAQHWGGVWLSLPLTYPLVTIFILSVSFYHFLSMYIWGCEEFRFALHRLVKGSSFSISCYSPFWNLLSSVDTIGSFFLSLFLLIFILCYPLLLFFSLLFFFLTSVVCLTVFTPFSVVVYIKKDCQWCPYRLYEGDSLWRRKICRSKRLKPHAHIDSFSCC